VQLRRKSAAAVEEELVAALSTNLEVLMVPEWRASSVQGGVGAPSLLCQMLLQSKASPAHQIWEDKTMTLNASFTQFPRAWKQRHLVSPW
jgi:hypothetical protein